MSQSSYETELRDLQIALVHVQRHMIDTEQSAVIIFEGRDSAGKGGTIKRITEHAAPRKTRVVALDKPSDRERMQWYLQRYIAHMPARGELVLFDRSWYNRAGVEHVMGFCTPDERETFFETVPKFETMISGAGATLIKYYLDISRDTQAARLEDRRVNPLKAWKLSGVDEVALSRYDDYTAARDEMLKRTSHPVTPWQIVRADDKKEARINVMRDLLRRLPRPDDTPETEWPDKTRLAEFSPELLETDFLSR